MSATDRNPVQVAADLMTCGMCRRGHHDLCEHDESSERGPYIMCVCDCHDVGPILRDLQAKYRNAGKAHGE